MNDAADTTDQAQDEALLGTDKLDSHLTVGAAQVPLADVVERAHADSGKSVKQWNALSQDTRDERIMKALADMRAEAANPPAEKEEAPSTEQKRAATVDDVAGDVAVHSDRGIGGSFIATGGGERIRIADDSQKLAALNVPDDSELA